MATTFEICYESRGFQCSLGAAKDPDGQLLLRLVCSLTSRGLVSHLQFVPEDGGMDALSHEGRLLKSGYSRSNEPFAFYLHLH